MRRVVLPLALLGAYALVAVPTAWAGTYTVSGTSDSASGSCTSFVCTDLRAAVAAANSEPGSTIELGEGQYELGPFGTHELRISADMEIVGAGPGKTWIFQTDGEHRVIFVTAGAVEISGILIGGGAVTGTAGSAGTTGGNGGIGEGGGILNHGSLTLVDDTIIGNSATGGAGGEGTTGNGGAGGFGLGGGVFSTGALTVEGTSVTGNSATSGAGGDTTGTGNGGESHNADGGGIFENGKLTVVDSTVNGNTTVAGEAGTSSGGGGSGGAGNAVGAGIDTQGASGAAIVNSTIAGNTATTPGGGYAIAGVAIANLNFTLTLANDTLAENQATDATNDVANLDQIEGTLATAGTIFAAESGAGVNCSLEETTVVGAGHDLEDDAGDSCGLSPANADLIGANPLLQPLAPNGGPTETMALGAGSPAIAGGGQCPDITQEGSPPLATDQRGVPRHNPCDVGAFEAARSAPPPSGPIAPQIASAAQSHRVWREGAALASFSRAKKHRPPLGTTFSFTLNEAADVSYSFKRTGVLRRRCTEPAKGKHGGRRPCKGLASRGTLSHTGRAGTNELHFFGRLGAAKRLAPGRYALTIVASSNGLSSAPATLNFTIAAAR